MLNFSKFALMLIVMFMVTACGSMPAVPIRVDEMKADTGLIYGQLRMPNEKWNDVRIVMIQKVGKVYGGGGIMALSERVHVTPDGRFIAENLVPGKYMLAGFMIADEKNFLGESAVNYTVDLKPGELHYLGTYNYVVQKSSNIFLPGSFSLEQNKSKGTHDELLTWVEEATRETKWHNKVLKLLPADRKVISKPK